ncbi:hypothetical protein H4W33_005220 [Kibdelosporangium phytohabitans]|nr:hypothetical protein [Kibdelosporangium phytohabitans]
MDQWIGRLVWLIADLLSGPSNESPDDYVDRALTRTLRRVAKWLLRSK